MSKNKELFYKNIDKLLFRTVVFFFLTLIVVQICLHVLSNSSEILVKKLKGNRGLDISIIDILPNYGEITFILDNYDDMYNEASLLINGEKNIFKSNRLDLQVKDGDLVEFKNESMHRKIKIKIEYVSKNIENLNTGDIIEIYPNTNKTLIIRFPE